MATKLKDLLDEELMSLYQGGDYGAFETLYYRHSGRVFEYLKKRSSEDRAEDLIQQVFEKLHKSRETYDSKYPFLPWLFTITRNTLFDHFKKAETKQTAKYDEPVSLDQVAAPDVSQNDYDFSDLLGGLNQNQRRAIELRYLHEWSFEKISEEINTSPLNVRKLISRGLKKIQLLLAERGGKTNE